jgi:hypothetical protein
MILAGLYFLIRSTTKLLCTPLTVTSKMCAEEIPYKGEARASGKIITAQTLDEE